MTEIRRCQIYGKDGGLVNPPDDKRAEWNQSQDAHDGKMYPPDAEAAMKKLRVEAHQRERDSLVRKLIFKARDLSEGISKCRTPEEMANVYDYIQKDAEEIAYIVSDIQRVAGE